jgi:hypothetical protein
VKPFVDILATIVNYSTTSSAVLEQFLHDILPYAIAPPHFPVDENCTAPPLPQFSAIDCSAFPRGFSGDKLSNPVKIAVFLKFAFESDILEANLREGYDVVDKYFIIVSGNHLCWNTFLLNQGLR